MQRMRPNLSPEPVETDFSTRGSCTRCLKDARCDAQAGICCYDFHAGYPFSDLATLPCSDVAMLAMVIVHSRDL